MIILGIDTSCDDTGVGIIQEKTVLANVVASQTALHAPFGGVVPENASREHLNIIDAVIEKALAEAQLSLCDIDAVAATYGPGLIGALLVGLTYAKALAWARDLPFIPVHHLEGHIASVLASHTVEPPFLCLVASGGHTSLYQVRAWGDYQELGRSRDDAAGEAFDKVARMLGLGYPGGPAVSKLAGQGDADAIAFPLPLKQQQGFDFSFSGIKTAVSLHLKKSPDSPAADIAASFEKTVVESLVQTSLRAAEAYDLDRLVVVGGVAANRLLRERFAQTALTSLFPPTTLATDNGAMIALAAAQRSLLQQTQTWQIDAKPYVLLGGES